MKKRMIQILHLCVSVTVNVICSVLTLRLVIGLRVQRGIKVRRREKRKWFLDEAPLYIWCGRSYLQGVKIMHIKGEERVRGFKV